MRRRERAAVAIILAAALIVGLTLVYRALEHAAQNQQVSMAAAQFNGVAASPPVETATPQPETSPSGQNNGQEETAPPPTESTAGVEATPAPTPSAQPEEVPSAGGGAMTLAALMDWMQYESSGALAAQSMLQAENALAAGVGTADDALRRTFAQSQAADNDTARRNQLAEEAAALGLEYLKCRDILALREDGVTFYRALEEMVRAQTEGDGAEDAPRREQALADLQSVQSARASAELALAEAEADLEAAVQALNTALGNPYGTAVQVTDVLTAEAVPTISGEEAAAQALSMRNELKAADYEIRRAQQTLDQLRYEYAPDSPQVLEQQAVLSQAQAAAVQAASQVESDVRDRLARLELQAQALELYSNPLDQPEADYVLAGGEEGTAWSSNLSALMDQWAEAEGDQASLIAGIAQLNLDVLCFQHAIGVGCAVAAI